MLIFPFPINDYQKKINVKNIDVIFLGNFDKSSIRNEYINFLLDNNIDVVENRDEYLDYNKYLEMFSRAKIVINFSLTGSKSELNQLKGRSFEAALMNCLLMEKKSDLIDLFFVPFEEYVPFSSKSELLEKINYYLNNDDERIKMVKKFNQNILVIIQ